MYSPEIIEDREFISKLLPRMRSHFLFLSSHHPTKRFNSGNKLLSIKPISPIWLVLLILLPQSFPFYSIAYLLREFFYLLKYPFRED